MGEPWEDELAPIAIIPAAGCGTRLGRLPGSKELLAVGFETAPDGSRRPRPIVVHLLDRLKAAGIEEAIVVLRAGKWDLPAYLADGRDRGLRIGYTVLESSPHVPFTVVSALPWTRGRLVALAFPDILFRPEHAFAGLLERLRATDAELVLGLFPTDRSEKTDMVELDAGGRPRRLVIKQPGSALRYTWSIAVWRPAFSAWLERWVAARESRDPEGRELHFGEAIQDAIEEGRSVEARVFEGGEYLDIGTPEDLERAVLSAQSPTAR
ncbi:MAG TPA: dTDP-glucose pyrophosphorylase [Thermoanaerobaculia bacterium]|nr:dTDP-glucose pyrophosphorylase [Thermoanaerobaculia bacterium]